MRTSDLDIAMERLKQKQLALVIAKRGTIIFETSSHGIGGLLRAIEQLNTDLADSSVADRIVGKAAALLCLYCGVFTVFAITASEKGIQALRASNVSCQFENVVPYILDSRKSGICPFENLVIDVSDPKEAYEKLKSFAAERKLS